MNALDYANARKNVIVRWAGIGVPAGTECALIPNETELPFDLFDVQGLVREDGSFEGVDLPDLTDGRGNTIYAVWLRVDEAEYDRQYADWESAV